MHTAGDDVSTTDNTVEYAACLYETYGERIFNLAYRMCGNREDAADITQETFIRVIKGLPAFRGEAQVYTWIYAIAANECRRHLARRRKASFTALEELIHAARDEKADYAFTENEKNTLIHQVKEGCLTGLLGCLTFQQRIAFILHTLLGMPLREVSAVLEKSEGAVKLLVHRAKSNLKDFLCRNCSLYDGSNACRCESLIHFSLKQGWISPANDIPRRNAFAAEKIEGEIRSLRREVELYSGLAFVEAPEPLERRIRVLMKSKDWAIFVDEKA